MKKTLILFRILGVIAIIFVLLLIIFCLVPSYSFPWTGLGDYIAPSGEFVRDKTLWDWMELLLVPMGVLLAATLLSYV